MRGGDFGVAAEPEIIGYGSVACVRPFLPSTYPSIIREGFFFHNVSIITDGDDEKSVRGRARIDLISLLPRSMFVFRIFFSFLKIGKCSRVVSIDRDRPIWSNHTHTHTGVLLNDRGQRSPLGKVQQRDETWWGDISPPIFLTNK